MARELKDVQQRPLMDDSSSLVLHARQTTFVMLILSALVVVGILVEDVSRLQRAVDDAESIRGLMNLWRSETHDKGNPVSMARILAGPEFESSDAKGRFRLGLAPIGDSNGNAVISCEVDLDLSQRFFVPEKGQAQRIVVRQSDKFESGSEINVEWLNISGESMWTEWLLKQPPYNLRSYSKFWDMLVSSNGSARVNTADLEKNLARGVSDFDQTTTITFASSTISGTPILEVAHVKILSDESQRGKKEAVIAPVDTYIRAKHWSDDSTILNIDVVKLPRWNERIEEWKNDNIDTAAVVLCRGIGDSETKLYPIVFPVKLQKQRFDWTKAWTDRAIAQGYLSRELRPTISNKPRLPFAQAFANLHHEAAGLESLELDALHGWLQGRLDRQGQRIEVAGIGIPRPLLRSLGLFLILVVQVYAALHLSEAALRMKSSAAGDPGAFQAWFVLYDGLLSLCAALGIVVAPTGAAVVVMWALHEGGFWTPYVLVSGTGLIISLVLASYSVQNVLRLRIEARRHREGVERYRTEASSQEAGQEPVGSPPANGHGSDEN